MSGETRLDLELVRRGMARSRGQARELLDAGAVRVDGVQARKASTHVSSATALAVRAGPQWVGRAAGKLLAALEAFGPAGLRVEGRRCLDVGASTGGFTQVLLTRGAVHVVALDVGHDQLAPMLRADPRVTERSGVNVREVDPAGLGGPFELVVADLSFISLRLVIDPLAALVAPEGDLVALIKPQFEVGRERLGKGGIVRAAADRAAAVRAVLHSAQEVGLGIEAVIVSPLRGGEGNHEYLGWMTRRPTPRRDADDLDRMLAAMHREERDQ